MPIKTLFKPTKIAIGAMMLLLSPLGPLKASTAQASTIGYDVTFADFGTPATGIPTGSTDYQLDFYLLPTAPKGDNSTTLTFSNFGYGGGSGDPSFGPLTDAPFQNNEISKPFVAGNSLSFHIDATYTSDIVEPDEFTFSFLDPSLNPTATDTTPTLGNAPGDGFSYFKISFDGTGAGGTPSVSTYAGNSPLFAAPTVKVASVVATPEPQTWAMMALGLGMVVLVMRRRKSDEEKGQVNGLTPVRVASE